MSSDIVLRVRSAGVMLRPEDFPPPLHGKAQVAACKLRATEIDEPPAYRCDAPVRVRGEKLSLPIVWRGRQWAVTGYGLECRDGTYAIAKKRLWENEEAFGWVHQMSGKVWIDLADFAEALRVARRYHKSRRRVRRGAAEGARP